MTTVAILPTRDASGEKSYRPIALECGFANQSHFAKYFRKHTGMNPKKFSQ